MYSVFLVDDDPILISGIKRIIDWGKNNCIITGTAANGTNAIKKIRKIRPDIVICDIAMPGISGIEVLRQVETEFPGTVFVMLTNHEDFEYARESLHFRAAEYIIKNNLNQETLTKALARAIKERENRNKLYRAKEADDSLQAEQPKEKIINALNNLLYQNKPLAPEDHALLLKEEMLNNFAFAFIPVNFTLLPGYQDISGEEQKKIFDWETEITQHLASSFFPFSLLSANYSRSGHAMLLYAWKLQPQAWETSIVRFRERLIKTSSQITRLGADVIASPFFSHIPAGHDNTEIAPCRVLHRIETGYYRNGKGAHPGAVQKATHYILNNIEKKITLQDVADFACISPRYLSTIFKREYKQNLFDFINQAKIDRACELIRENKYQINRISSLLGFENAVYFSRIFKRFTGTTPSEYKGMSINR